MRQEERVREKDRLLCCITYEVEMLKIMSVVNEFNGGFKFD
jgi:hypothetical protein